MTPIGRWRLAALFLAIAVALLLLICFFGIYLHSGPDPDFARLGILMAPFIAAAITGMLWRDRLSAYPDWAMRRPFSRAMAYLLFVLQTVSPMLVGAWLLHRSGVTLADLARDYSEVLAIAFTDGSAAILIFALIVQLLICMIQTEVGLFIGVWFKDRAIRKG